MSCIVIDFDGPIFDSRAAMWTALQRTQAQLDGRIALELPPQSTLPLLSAASLIGLVCAQRSDADRKLALDAYTQHLAAVENTQKISEPVRRTLKDLHEHGCKIVLFSGRSIADLTRLVTRLGIASAVEPLDPSATGAKLSSDYLRTLRTTAGAAMVVVGDTDLDHLTAADAGVPYYHAEWTGEPAYTAPRKAQLKLESIGELASIFIDTAPLTDAVDERELRAAARRGEFCFYAGAGISVPSGFGDWQHHYLPILEQLDASYLCRGTTLIEALQIVCSDPQRSREVFDAFRHSFATPNAPNPYHYAMLRANPVRIWTSNYDGLFERAIAQCTFDRHVVNDDAELLEHFGADTLIKMNGDFNAARFNENLEWNLVFLQEQFDRAEVQRPEIWRLFEDDYRNRTMIFVGVSFTDPALRRVVSIARRKIARTRYTHYLLQLRAKDPAARNQQALFAANLRRSDIVTIFKDTHEELEAIVRRIAVDSNRPIVGFSGSGGHVADEENSRALTLPGMAMACGDVDALCAALGGELARLGYRVSSGSSQFVGTPAVEAAFDVDPSSARFYLRRSGGRAYRRTAPAIVVGGSDYSDMRQRFVPELSFLIGVGGQPRDDAQKPGTVAEIEMALERGIPVLLFPQAGGSVAAHWSALRDRMRTSYRDARLAAAVGEANDRIKALAPQDLLRSVASEVIALVDELIALAAGAETRDSDGPAFRQRQHW